MLFLLDIGHSKKKPGACNKADGICEFPFNDELASEIIDSYVGAHTIKKSYRKDYDTLPDHINEQNPDYVISLHCNAFDETASYTTVLYYKDSQRSKRLAEILQRELVSALGLRDAGIKPIGEEDRGGSQVMNITCPNVIAEPFFIDNDSDLATAQARRKALIQAYIAAFGKAAAMSV